MVAGAPASGVAPYQLDIRHCNRHIGIAMSKIKPELLLPELRPYVQNGWLHHDLVVQSDCDCTSATAVNTMANKQYKIAKAACAKAWAAGDWSEYIWMHAKPYRLPALLRVLSVCDPASAPELVACVWQDSENIRQARREWIAVWRQLSDPHATMDAVQRKAFAALPDPVTVYRGFSGHRRGHRGLAWTVDRTKAEWFARRFCFADNDTPCVASGRVRKNEVFAYFGGGEQEIIVHPDKVRGMRVTALTAARKGR
jgi:hypothetical protein